MGQISGTNLASPIVPFTTDDKFPTHIDEYGKGGYRAVADLSALANIPDSRRSLGMLVYVISENEMYQYKLNIVTQICEFALFKIGEVTSVNGLKGVVTLTTSEISEGTNLYFTNARVNAALDANPKINGNTIYHTGNANRRDVDWNANNFVANGYIEANYQVRGTAGGSDWGSAGIMTNANTDGGYYPAIDFHWPNQYGGTIAMPNSADFKFYQINRSSYANIYANSGIFTGNLTANNGKQVWDAGNANLSTVDWSAKKIRLGHSGLDGSVLLIDNYSQTTGNILTLSQYRGSGDAIIGIGIQSKTSTMGVESSTSINIPRSYLRLGWDSLKIAYAPSQSTPIGGDITSLTEYNIYHSGNANLSNVDWSANNLYASGNINIINDWQNNKGLYIKEGGSDAYGAYFTYGLNDELKIGTKTDSADYDAIIIHRGLPDVNVVRNLTANGGKQVWDAGNTTFTDQSFLDIRLNRTNGVFTGYRNINAPDGDSQESAFGYVRMIENAQTGAMIAVKYYGADVGNMYFQSHIGGNYGTWNKVWHSGNSNKSDVDWNAYNLILHNGQINRPAGTSFIVKYAGAFDDFVINTYGDITTRGRLNVGGNITANGGKQVWDAGNANLSTVDWNAKNLFIDNTLTFKTNIVGLNNDGTANLFLGAEANGLGNGGKGSLLYSYSGDIVLWANALPAARINKTTASFEGNLTANNGKQVWHAGNSNLSNVDWNAQNLKVNKSFQVGSAWNANNSRLYGDIEFGIADIDTAGKIGGIRRIWADSINGGVSIQYANAGVLYDGLGVDRYGNVGIGTTYASGMATSSSLIKLEINGAVKITGNLTANGGKQVWDAGNSNKSDADWTAKNVIVVGEVITSAPNHTRAIYNNRAVITRIDDSNYYHLVTNAGDPWGGFNSLRPFYFNLDTGNVTMGHSVSIAGNLTANNGKQVWDAGNFVNQEGSRTTTDYNNRLNTGFYNGEATPANAPNGYGQLIVAHGLDTGLQIAGGHSSDNLYFRGWSGGGTTWTPWRTVYHAGNSNKSDVDWNARVLNTRQDANAVKPINIIPTGGGSNWYLKLENITDGNNLLIGSDNYISINKSTGRISTVNGSYMVYDAGNANLSTVDWNAKNLTASNSILTKTYNFLHMDGVQQRGALYYNADAAVNNGYAIMLDFNTIPASYRNFHLLNAERTYIDGLLQVSGTITTGGNAVIHAGNITNYTAGSSYDVKIRDVRNDNFNAIPPSDSRYDNKLRIDFKDNLGLGRSWDSVMTIKGWSNDYYANQLAFNADGGASDESMYIRSGRTTWGSWRKVYDAGNSNRSDVDWNAKNINASGNIYNQNSQILPKSVNLGPESDFFDSANKIPWYGLGRVSSAAVMLNGYYGINFRTNSGNITFDVNGTISTNGEVVAGGQVRGFGQNNTFGLAGIQTNGNNGAGIIPRRNGLQYTNTAVEGTGLNGAGVSNPNSDWWHHLIQNHGNGLGFYVDIASSFHSDDIKFRRMAAGTLSNWVTMYHSSNANLSTVDWAAKNITASGAIYASGNITAKSDRRLKNNIKTLEVRGDLNPVTYVRDGKNQIGFIAQEVQEIYPELVEGTESETEYLSLNYQQLTAVLYAEILELKKSNMELKNRIKILEEGK